ncbi:MAG: DUF1302 family protein [Rhodospirillaceae bacterium]|nr:DUF1302 family protein [Rhodospirillaceae bacterium]
MTALLGRSASVPAAELVNSGDTVIRWDNTIKYSAAYRLGPADGALIQGPNADDGDRNFHAGAISNRFDVLSELDANFGRWGASVSAAAWYDTIYNNAPDADTSPQRAIYPVRDHFSSDVRDLHGRYVELLNAFVTGSGEIGEMPVSVRAGRHTVLWGESLFFAANGIAAGQGPIDTIKAMSVPLSRAKEVFMPVNQISLSAQPRPDMVINAYYQFEWRKSRLPGVGSYFSAADFVDAGGYRLYVGRNQYLGRETSPDAKDSGQFGIALRFIRNDYDVGVYALRYHAKEPQLYMRPYPRTAPAAERERSAEVERPAAYGSAPGVYAGPSNPLQSDPIYDFGTGTGEMGNYFFVYPENIEIYGASFSGYLGDSNVAAEISTRRRMPLASKALLIAGGTAWDADKNALFARGDTLHAQASIVSSFSPNRAWDSASFSAEIAANSRLKVTRNTAMFDDTRTRSYVGARALFEPVYFAVLPGMDLSVPMSVGYGLAGRSSVDSGQVSKAGSFELGLSGTYRAAWRGSLTFTRFLGAPHRQPFADRHFVSFSIQTTF